MVVTSYVPLILIPSPTIDQVYLSTAGKFRGEKFRDRTPNSADAGSWQRYRIR